MDKLFEKKNLGIPATLLAVFAYFLGYYISISYAGFLVAIIFAVIVFALDFDDKVKTAVKQAYALGFIFCLVYFGLGILDEITVMISKIHILNRVFTELNTYASSLFHMFVIIIFTILVIMTLCKKDVKINFILNMLEGTAKPKQQAYQQPMQGQMYQQPPMPQQPVQPICPKCGTVNHAGATFCASCGQKL